MVDKLFQPTTGYGITLSINNDSDTPYSSQLEEVRVLSSLASAWTSVILSFFIPPHIIVTDKLFGQDEIILKIDFLGQDETIKETVEFDLLMISQEFDIPVTTEIATENQEDRTILRIQTVTRVPFTTMTTMVNKVYGVQRDPMTPKEVIDDLISEYASGIETTEWGGEDNPDAIRQVCIPPTTLYDAINYIDRTFGIFPAVAGIFCKYDNTLLIKNLAEEIGKEPILKIDHITIGENDKMESEDPTELTTYDNIKTAYTGNAKFGYYGKTLKFVVLPNDKLHETIELDLEDISTDYGPFDGSDVLVHQDLDRVKYYIEHGGFGESETFAITAMAKNIYDTVRTRISIERNFYLDPLLSVGSVVKLGIKTLEHKPMGSNYILFSTDIKFVKAEAGFESTADLELVKTNRTV